MIHLYTGYEPSFQSTRTVPLAIPVANRGADDGPKAMHRTLGPDGGTDEPGELGDDT